MECCNNTEHSNKKEDAGKGSKTGSKLVLGIVIGIVFMSAVFIAFKLGSSNEVSSTSTGKLDTSGWTENEIMNYEMHGTIPLRAEKTSASSSGSGMVGGC